MHAPIELADIAADVLARIRERAPRVHCITNTVAQQYTANMLLAAGAVPTTLPGESVPGRRRVPGRWPRCGQGLRPTPGAAGVDSSTSRGHALRRRTKTCPPPSWKPSMRADAEQVAPLAVAVAVVLAAPTASAKQVTRSAVTVATAPAKLRPRIPNGPLRQRSRPSRLW